LLNEAQTGALKVTHTVDVARYSLFPLRILVVVLAFAVYIGSPDPVYASCTTSPTQATLASQCNLSPLSVTVTCGDISDYGASHTYYSFGAFCGGSPVTDYHASASYTNPDTFNLTIPSGTCDYARTVTDDTNEQDWQSTGSYFDGTDFTISGSCGGGGGGSITIPRLSNLVYSCISSATGSDCYSATSSTAFLRVNDVGNVPFGIAIADFFLALMFMAMIYNTLVKPYTKRYGH